MRFSRPKTTSRFRKPMSPSMHVTFLPCAAKATEIFATEVVLPTPPLPDAIVTTCAVIFPSCLFMPRLCHQLSIFQAGDLRLAFRLFFWRDGDLASDT